VRVRGSCECVFWSDKFRQFAEVLQPDAVLVFIGKCEINGDNVKIFVDEALTLEQAEKKLTKGYLIRVNPDQVEYDTLKQLRDRCNTSDAMDSLKFLVVKGEGRVQYTSMLKIKASKETTKFLTESFGDGNVLIDVES